MKFFLKLLKSKIFWTAAIIILIIGAVLVRFIFKQTPVEYVTEAVKRGSVVQTVEATGKVKAATEIELNFKNSGTLSAVSAKVGDQVEAGKVLAQLRAGDVASSVERAQASLAEAQANLRKVKAGATAQDVAVYQAAVDKAAADVASAKTTLENTERTYKLALENEQSSALNVIGGALTKANISLRHITDTIYYEGNANNFSTSNVSLHQRLVSNNSLATIAVDEAELRYNEAKIGLSDTALDLAMSAVKNALAKTSETLSDLTELFEYVNLTSVLTQSDLDTLKTTISTERVTTNASITAVGGADEDLADARLDYQIKIQDAKNSLNTIEKTLAKAKADLELRRAPSRQEDVALAEAQVLRAQADLQSAREQYNETILRAPIAGVVVEVNYSVGERTATDPVVVMLAKERYEIEVDVPESDIVKVSVGQRVDITLDAFSDSDVFTGVVTTINPAQTEIQDVIYYRVTVTFIETQPEAVGALSDKIKPGMTANVAILTNQVSDALSIPIRAVKEQDGKKRVEVLENGKPVVTDVSLGLRGDNGLVQVLSGLTEGQMVVTFVRNGK